MTNKKYDIYDRIFKLVVKIIKLTRLIYKSEENKIIVSQLLRSSTSMGANAQEADGVSSKKDFLHCFTIVRKEAKETIFWLRLISELNPKVSVKVESLLKENEEITAIISKIISNSRSRSN